MFMVHWFRSLEVLHSDSELTFLEPEVNLNGLSINDLYQQPASPSPVGPPPPGNDSHKLLMLVEKNRT